MEDPAPGEDFGSLRVTNLEAEIKKNGFTRARRSAAWAPLTKRRQCVEYRRQFSGLLRYAWFFKKDGFGCGYEIYWNFGQLSRGIAVLEETRLLSWKKMLLKRMSETDAWLEEIGAYVKYRDLAEFLLRYDSPEFGLGMSTFSRRFVAIPGIENVTARIPRNLLERLHRILSDDWYARKSTAKSGPKSKFLDDPILDRFIRGRVRRHDSIQRIADDIERILLYCRDNRRDSYASAIDHGIEFLRKKYPTTDETKANPARYKMVLLKVHSIRKNS